LFDPTDDFIQRERFKAFKTEMDEKFRLFHDRIDHIELKFVTIIDAPRYIMETILPINVKLENKIEKDFKEFKLETEEVADANQDYLIELLKDSKKEIVDEATERTKAQDLIIDYMAQ